MLIASHIRDTTPPPRRHDGVPWLLIALALAAALALIW